MNIKSKFHLDTYIFKLTKFCVFPKGKGVEYYKDRNIISRPTPMRKIKDF